MRSSGNFEAQLRLDTEREADFMTSHQLTAHARAVLLGASVCRREELITGGTLAGVVILIVVGLGWQLWAASSYRKMGRKIKEVGQ